MAHEALPACWFLLSLTVVAQLMLVDTCSNIMPLLLEKLQLLSDSYTAGRQHGVYLQQIVQLPC
jgi:hypothetical protein